MIIDIILQFAVNNKTLAGLTNQQRNQLGRANFTSEHYWYKKIKLLANKV